MEAETVMASINCVTFNHVNYIRKALDSFLMQKTDFAFEILVHDDPSTDGTSEIIREYEARYPGQVRPLIQKENQYSQGIDNISGAFNFPRARGKYIFMCDGDDYFLSPDKLQRQVDYMEAHPDCTLCIHSARIDLVGKALTEGQMRPYRKSRVIPPEEIIDKTSGYPTASLMFYREMVDALPDFYNHAPIADIPLQLLAANRGWAWYMDEPMCVYRLGGAASWTTLMKQGNYEKKQQDYAASMTEMYRGFDAFSGGRFHNTVEHAIKRLIFLTQVNTKHFDTVLNKENREFYRELNARTRFFIRFETSAPKLYAWLQQQFHRG